MKTPEFGDIIVTNNDQHWVCADSKTILDKVGSDPMVKYAEDTIKAYSADLKAFSFMVWKSDSCLSGLHRTVVWSCVMMGIFF